MDFRTKKLLTEIQKDPWLGMEWTACHEEPIAEMYVILIDDAIFEGDRKKALELAYIFRGVSRRVGSRHIECKSEACLGSAFRFSHLFDLADEQLERARELVGSCHDCQGEVWKRRGAMLYYIAQYEESLGCYHRALGHMEQCGDKFKICDVLLGRAGVYRLLEGNSKGMEDVVRAIDLIFPEMPSRYYIAAAVNAISLAAGSDDEAAYVTAMAIAERLREKMKGIKIHSRVRGIVRWIRGLAFEKLRDITNGVRFLESAISTFERLDMREERKTAMADLARIRRKGKQRETNDRHILRLIEETLRLDVDEETVSILERSRSDPSESNILAWRSALDSYVPNLEPVPEKRAVV